MNIETNVVSAVAKSNEESLLNEILAATEIKQDTCKAALQKTSYIPSVDVPQLKLRHGVADNKLSEYTKLSKSLWPCEVEQANDLLAKMVSIQGELKDIEKTIRDAVRDALYPQIIDQEVLKWRTAEGWPSLALFDIYQPMATISIENWFIWEKDSAHRRRIDVPDRRSVPCPDELASLYHDVIFHMVDVVEEECSKRKNPLRAGDRINAQLTCTFGGIIPAKDKVAIKDADKYFNKVYILAETPNWDLKYQRIPAPAILARTRVDPIAVGWDGKNLHVITSFDLTTIEQAILESNTHEITP
jgi:hypothetical protein